MQIIRVLLDKKGNSPQETVQTLGLGKAKDEAVQKAVCEAVAESATAGEGRGREGLGKIMRPIPTGRTAK